MSLAVAIDIAKILLVITFVAVTTSLVTYTVTATWWRTVMGRAIVTEQVTMWIVIGYTVARAFIPGHTPIPVALGVYFVIAAGQITFMVSIWLSWLASRKLKKDEILTNGQLETNA